MNDVDLAIGRSAAAQVTAGETAVRTLVATDPALASRATAGSQIQFTDFYDKPKSSAVSRVIAVAAEASPYVHAWRWSTDGFGAKYTNPATLPGAPGNDLAFSPDGLALVAGIGQTTNGYTSVGGQLIAYKWSASGFGTKYADPSGIPNLNGRTNAVAFSPSGSAIVIGSYGYTLDAWKWDNATGFGTKYAAPDQSPITSAQNIVFSPDGSVIMYNGIHAYKWDDTLGFGTKYAQPAVGWPVSASQGPRRMAFSPDGSAVAVALARLPYIAAWKWNNATGFGTKYADPSPVPAAGSQSGFTYGYSVAFSPDNAAIVIGNRSTPYINAYRWTSASGFGTKYANPATLPGNGSIDSIIQDVKFNSDGSALACTSQQSPGIHVYNWTSASGFGTKYANPAVLPTITTNPDGSTNPPHAVAWGTAGDSITGYLVVGNEAFPFIAAYPWWGNYGFGSKLANPASPPINSVIYLTFSADRAALAISGGGSSAGIIVYRWSSAGFGTRYANPTTLPFNNASTGAIFGIAFAPNGSAIACATYDNAGPYIYAYPWSKTTGFGTKYANPSQPISGAAFAVEFSPDSSALVVGHDVRPWMDIYRWSASGFGAKYTAPASGLPGACAAAAFSPDGSSIILGHTTSPYVSAYPWNSTLGFGTKYAAPSPAPTTDGSNPAMIKFSPDGSAVAMATSASPYIYVYKWSASGFGTRYANPTTLPPDKAFSVGFSRDGSAIAVGHFTSPSVTVYSWNNASGFGAKYANPTTLPPGDTGPPFNILGAYVDWA